MADTVSWLGEGFKVLPKNANWRDIGGVYIFAGVNSQNQWYPLYVGRTGSLADRIPSHPRWTEARLLGATHVHAKVVRLAGDREYLEDRLIRSFRPRMNVTGQPYG